MSDESKQEEKDINFVIEIGKEILIKINAGIATNNAIASKLEQDKGTVSRHIHRLISLGLIINSSKGNKTDYPKKGTKGRTVHGEKIQYKLTDDCIVLASKLLHNMDKEILRNATLEIIRRSRIPTADDFVRLDKIKRFLFQSHELLNRNANLEGIVGNILEEALKLNAEQVYSWAEEQDAKTLISNILSMPESDKSSEIKVRLVRVYLRAARQNTSRTENDLVPWFRRLVLKEKANIGREALPTISELVRRESSVSENVLNLLLETAWIQHGKGIESNADILDYLIDTIIEIWPFLTNAQRQSFHRSIENISAAEFGDYKSSVNENRPPENTRDIDLERHRIFKSRLGKL